MKKVFCSVDERFADPLFEVFDGGDFILSSYRDIESPKTELSLFFPEPERAREAERRLRQALDIVGLDVPVAEADIPDEDWKFAYRRHFKVENIGERLVTVPAWEAERFFSEDRSGRIALVLDPGMAFGTGKHETTRACLEYIDEIAAAGVRGRSFLDMGCGSGILSIAAAKLGFAPVEGFDIDEEAVEASKENAAANGVCAGYRVFALGKGAVGLDDTIEAAKGIYPDLALQGKADGAAEEGAPRPADVVAANILGPLLIAFAEEIAGYAKGTLIVSGILEELYPDVLAAFAKFGFGEVSRKTIGEWTTGRLERV
ncbi:MAG: 50S ribosomal protein L11 methyltransferase [Kiritimatiellae bacterium]|nr:50S ribosomal protein L11 methyltransferase [Kiritimatiellia bacterium]